MKKNLLTIFLLFWHILSPAAISLAYAQESSSSAQPAPTTQTPPASTPTPELLPPLLLPTAATTPAPSVAAPTVTPEERIFNTLSPTNTPTPSLMPTPAFSAPEQSGSSGKLKPTLKFRSPGKKDYRADESVTIQVTDTNSQELQTEVIDAAGKSHDWLVQKESNSEFSTLRLPPSLQFHPGVYTLRVSNGTLPALEKQFSWGTLQLHLNQSVYTVGEAAQLTFTVTDEQGAVVCAAPINLTIKGPTTQAKLSTADGTIVTSAACTQHGVSPDPDYSATYTVPAAGIYELSATATVKQTTYTIDEILTAADTQPVTITRTMPTRLSPPTWYETAITVHANEDFSGSVTDTVPEFVEVAASGQPDRTTYASITAVPSTFSSETTLGTRIPPLHLPYDHSAHITLGFGENIEDPLEAKIYSQFGLSGHDGIDFDLASGSAVLAADSGVVALAGSGDYGTTIVLDHPWGRSYYGHLSQPLVTFGQKITKGEKIALSGATGLATGPHLHFGIKPAQFDKFNGYYGKINPLPYLSDLSQAARTDLLSTNQAQQIRWDVTIKKGSTVTLGYRVKIPNFSQMGYLFGPLQGWDSHDSPVITGATHLWSVTADTFAVRGAQFQDDTPRPAMQPLDQRPFSKPEEFTSLPPQLDTDLGGTYGTLRLDSNAPTAHLSIATSSGTPHTTTMTLQDTRSSQARIASDHVVWSDVLAATDLAYYPSDGYIDQRLIIKDDTAPKTFRFALATDTESTVQDYFGYGLIKNPATKEEYALLQFPQGIDAKNQRIDFKYEFADHQVTIYPNRSWQLASATYPITISFPLHAIPWNEALVQVGQGCADAAACGQDGDIMVVRPAGFVWGTGELTKYVVVKTPTYSQDQRDEFESKTIEPEPPPTKPAKDQREQLIRTRTNDSTYPTPELKRYGLDYTKFAPNAVRTIIRDKEKTEFAPKLDGKKAAPIEKKKNPTVSVVPEATRLVYQPPSLLTRLWQKFMHPAYAANHITTIGTAGRTYSTLAAWETAENTGTLTVIQEGDVYNDSTFTLAASFTIDGATGQTSSIYAWVVAAPGERHNGTATKGVLVDCNNAGAFRSFVIRDDYVRVEWMRSTRCTGGGGAGSVRIDAATNVLVQNMVIYNDDDAANSNNAIQFASNATADSATFRNIILYDVDRSAIRGSDGASADTATIENVTAYSNDGSTETTIGIDDDATSVFTVKNTISASTSTSDFVLDNAGSAATYSISEDATADDTGGTGTLINRTIAATCATGDNRVVFVNITAGSEDFHLSNACPAENDAIDAGTTPSDGYTDDIDNQTRPFGRAWDIGADEAGPSNAQLLRHGEWFDYAGSRKGFTF